MVGVRLLGRCLSDIRVLTSRIVLTPPIVIADQPSPILIHALSGILPHSSFPQRRESWQR